MIEALPDAPRRLIGAPIQLRHRQRARQRTGTPIRFGERSNQSLRPQRRVRGHVRVSRYTIACTSMTDSRRLLQHFLGALAYRTQKALRGAPASFAEFRAAPTSRTPFELVWHM